MIRIFAYGPLPRGIKGAHTGGLRSESLFGLLVFLVSQSGLFVVVSSSWVLLPFTVCLWGNEPSVGAKVISPRSRDHASWTERPPSPLSDPEHQQFPLPLIRAEIAPEATFVALSGHTCRREVRARGPRQGGVRSRGRESKAGRRAQESRDFLFFWGFCVNVCGWRQSVR